MMLPTLLESVLTRADADGEAHVDGEWLDKASPSTTSSAVIRRNAPTTLRMASLHPSVRLLLRVSMLRDGRNGNHTQCTAFRSLLPICTHEVLGTMLSG